MTDREIQCGVRHTLSDTDLRPRTTPTNRSSWRCRLGFHSWLRAHGAYDYCERCEAYR